jgi:hypothetical protein
VVERARLESWYRGNSIEGSNPSLSAKNLKANVLALAFILNLSCMSISKLHQSIYLLTALCYGSTAFGQIHDHDHGDHEHHHPHHEHSLELGAALNPVWMIAEQELTSGLHLHLVKTIGMTKWGVGLGYERIFDDHQHSTAGIVGSYRFTPEWAVNLSPGVTWEG